MVSEALIMVCWGIRNGKGYGVGHKGEIVNMVCRAFFLCMLCFKKRARAVLRREALRGDHLNASLSLGITQYWRLFKGAPFCASCIPDVVFDK